jgi:outer membrane protein OmpA-like peptidoglycan-associated protein
MNATFRLVLGLSSVVCLSSLAPAAFAQDEGFAVNRFEPAEAGSDWFASESLDFRGHVRPAIGLTIDYAHKPLVLYDADGEEVHALVESQLSAHLGASLILWERLRLGLSVPFVLTQSGEQGSVAGTPIEYSGDTALGDIRLGADVRLAGEYGGPFSIALGVQVHLPTGDRAAYSGDGGARLTPRLLIAGDIAVLAYSLRGGVAYRAQDDGIGNVPTGTEFTFGASLGLRLGRLLIGPELYGTTVISDGDSAFKKATTPLELLFGVHYKLTNWIFGLGAGPGITQGLGAPAFRVIGSIEWAPGYEEELPPSVMEDPPPPPDRDEDRIFDARDACPDDPGEMNDDPKKNGCPPDSDGDGIYDAQDACKDVAGAPNDDFSKHGCPPDGDGDGIADALDSCPEVAGVASDDANRHGCPPDADGDDILDSDDACPSVAGPRNVDPAKHGCPKARVEKGEIKITERIEFKTNSSKLLPSSFEILEEVRAILEKHPEITLLSLEGHTDNVGRAKYNQKLSQLRTESVLKWLVQNGIDRKRLKATGYGSSVPLADNDTEEGREKNRRVEFHIREQVKSADSEESP